MWLARIKTGGVAEENQIGNIAKRASQKPQEIPGKDHILRVKGIDTTIDGDYTRGMSSQKTLRNQALRDYAQAHPELALKEIGQVFGLRTRQRVWAILRQGGLRRITTYYLKGDKEVSD